MAEVAATNIGERLQSARLRAGLSQAEACRRAGLGESSLSEFENGRRDPSLAQLTQLAAVYSRSVASLLTDDPIAEQTVLWRERPVEAPTLEVEFLRLAEQYANLEKWCNDVRPPFRLPPVTKAFDDFTEADAEELARTVCRDLGLGDRPATNLLGVLEEDLGIKVFHKAFAPTGTAACSRSPNFGYAILLNAKNTRWRRNFDLAHELFHLLTWETFRATSATTTKREEKLANKFAASLLLPADAVKSMVTRRGGKLSAVAVFEVVREFDVSVEALAWRLYELYGGGSADRVKQRIAELNAVGSDYENRTEEPLPQRPRRFHMLAVDALRTGKMSTGRFAEYLGISRSQALKYAAQEAESDEALELPVA